MMSPSTDDILITKAILSCRLLLAYLGFLKLVPSLYLAELLFLLGTHFYKLLD